MSDVVATPALELVDKDFRNELLERLRKAEEEPKPLAHFVRQWRWLGIPDDELIELQLIAPTAPDERLGDELRRKNRLNSSLGEYRAANRYARAEGLRSAVELLKHARDNYQYQGIYIIPSMLKPAVAAKAARSTWLQASQGSGTTDNDIERRRVLMFDVDPMRAGGVKDISASPDERNRAVSRAVDLYGDLVDLLGGEASLAFVSSGNGAQVHLRVGLDAENETTTVVQRLLKVLDAIYSTETEEIDLKVFDPKRLFPACGTLKRKGLHDEASGRVHRTITFVAGDDVPTAIGLAEVRGLLETLESRLTSEQKDKLDPPKKTSKTTRTTSDRAVERQGHWDAFWSAVEAITIVDVMAWLGTEGTCPGCGSTSGADDLTQKKGVPIWKCLHNTCAEKGDGKGSYNTRHLVIEARRDEVDSRTRDRGKDSSDPKALMVTAAILIAEQFNIPVPSGKRDPKPLIESLDVGLGLNSPEVMEALEAIASLSTAAEREGCVKDLSGKIGLKYVEARAASKTVVELRKASKTKDAEDDPLTEIMLGYSYVRSTTDRVFARCGNRYIPCDTPKWRQKVAAEFTARTKGYVSSEMIDRVMLSIAGGNLQRVEVPIRYASDQGRVFVDLGDVDGHVVEITAEGVRVVTESPVGFFRPASQEPLPVPIVPSTDEEAQAVLARYRSLLAIEDDASWYSCLAWQVQVMRRAKSYSILQARSPMGTGKTTRARLLRRPIDPSRPEVSRLPADLDVLALLGENSHLLSFDNLGRVPKEISDGLCRVATGDGGEKRELYTTRDLARFECTNPIIMSSITVAASEPDLQDRSLVVKFGRPAKRRTEEDIDADYYGMHPEVFGALCYLVSICLARTGSVSVPVEVRMQGPCSFAAGLEDRIVPDGAIIDAYLAAREESQQTQAEDAWLSAFIRHFRSVEEWTGTMADLLASMERDFTEEGQRRPKWLPETVQGLRTKLDVFAAAIESAGLKVDRSTWVGRGASRRKVVRVLNPAAVLTADDLDRMLLDTDRMPANESDPEMSGIQRAIEDGSDGCDGSDGSSFSSTKTVCVCVPVSPASHTHTFSGGEEKHPIHPIHPIQARKDRAFSGSDAQRASDPSDPPIRSIHPSSPDDELVDLLAQLA